MSDEHNKRDDIALVNDIRKFLRMYYRAGLNEHKLVYQHLQAAVEVIGARDAALREARAEIENLRSDAANDAGHIQAMKRGFDQLYEAIGIAPKGDHWPDYLFRVKTEVGFLREQEAVSAYREMRLWHEARYKEARDLAQDDGVAGAHAAAHYTAIEYCRSRETEQIPEHGDHAKPEPKEE